MPGMEDLAQSTADETDAALKDQETALLASTNLDWNSLSPQLTDQESFNKLMAAVREAQEKNESVAQLRARITSLGKGVIETAKKVAAILS